MPFKGACTIFRRQTSWFDGCNLNNFDLSGDGDHELSEVFVKFEVNIQRKIEESVHRTEKNDRARNRTNGRRKL